MVQRKTKIEIINETVATYSPDPFNLRSINGARCLYKHGEKKCAYSRCWKDGAYKTEFEGKGVVNSAMPHPDTLLKEEYQGHNIYFWMEIQDLHDEPTYWATVGLSRSGQVLVNQLLDKYKNN